MQTDHENGLAGVQFPVGADGRRSTTRTGQAVLAAAVGRVDAGLAEAISRESDWRRRYGAHLVDFVTLALERGGEAVTIVDDGLAAVHETFRFHRRGREITPREAMGRYADPAFATATVAGNGERQTELQVPVRGEQLRGDALRRQLDDWAERGKLEPGAVDALRRLQDRPDWLDLRDLHFALLGAGAEVGPFEVLSRLGANLLAVDLDRAHVWRRLIATARAGAGCMHFPVREALPDDAADDRIAAVAGADLLTMTPEIRTWLAGFDTPFCIGGYAYLHGPDHVRVEVAMDAIMEDLTRDRRDIALAFLLTPTDVFVVPEEAARAARAAYEAAGAAALWRAPLRALSGGRLYAPNAEQDVYDANGKRFGLYDGIVPQQGPNYALAKRIQKWRALAARAGGHRVSANVAPSTATASVLMRREFAAAFAGAKHYGVEVFEPATTNAVMAGLLVHDLREDACPANPTVELDHPLELFMNQSVHGGLWRAGLKLRSVLEIAAIRGFLGRRDDTR
jgi:hypothetical protein